MTLRDELVQAVAKRSGLPPAKSADVVDSVLDRLGAYAAAAGPTELDLGGKHHAWLVPAEDERIVDVVRDVVRLAPGIVAARRARVTEDNINKLVDVFLGDNPLAGAMRAIEADNARERARFVQTVPTLTSKDLATMAGHSAANASVTGSRWKQQGKVFSLPWRGGELYPAFQFRDGRPHPTVKAVLEELPGSITPWQIAFWFISSNSWLDGRTPAESLNDKTAVTMAARRRAEPLIG